MATARKTTARKPAAKANSAAASRFTKKPAAANSTASSTSSASNPFAGISSPFTSLGGAGQQDWLKNSSEFMQKFFDQGKQGFGTANFGDWQKQMPNFGAPQSSNFGKNMDSASRSISEAMSMSTESMQMLAESSTSFAEMARKISEELTQLANDTFTGQVELSKEMLQCRNVNDLIELQSKAAQQTMEKLYEESVRLSDMVFKTASEISEPIQQRATKAAERLTKSFK